MAAAPVVPSREVGPRHRAGVVLPIATFLAALVAALLGGPGGGGPVLLGETVAGTASGAVHGVATTLPLGLAFGAGMLAALNPCGFALLPAFLGVSLRRDGDDGVTGRLLRALRLSVVVSLSFVLMFGAAGLVLGIASSTLAASFGWIGLAVGILLIAAAGRVLGGRSLSLDLGGRLAARLGGASRRPTLAGHAAYGTAYGLASLGCALPAFLAVAGTTISAGGALAAALRLLLYALGLALVFSAAAVAAAVVEIGVLARLRPLARHLPVVSGVLLLLAGAYVTYYWLTVGGVIAQVVQWTGVD